MPGSVGVSSGQVLHYVDAATTNPSAGRYCNATPLTFPNAVGSGAPYPTRIQVSGLAGIVSKVTVELNGLTHQNPDDLDLMITGPNGNSLIAVSDVGGANPVSGLNIILDSTVGQVLPDGTALTSGTFRPEDFQVGSDTFAAPAPTANVLSASNATLGFAFNTSNPNGLWTLWTANDNAGAQGGGSLANGWCLNFTLTAPTLTISKTHAGNFSQGQTGAQYTVTVGSNGPGSTAGTISMVETPPAGLTISAMSGNGWTCTVATATCTTTAVLAANGSLPPITVTVNVAANAPSSVVNEVAVSGGGATGASTTDTTVITQNSPDLTVTKVANGTFTQGGTASYTLTITNSGTGPTTASYGVTDPMPTGLTAGFTTGPDIGWSCVGSTSTIVRCSRLTPLAANESSTLNIPVTIASDAPASITNTATLAGGGEVNTGNNSGSVTVSVVPAAPDLVITKVAQGSTFQQGGTVSYKITVTNVGTGPATGAITMQDTLPAGLTFAGASFPGWNTCTSSSNFICTRSTGLAVDASAEITLHARIAANAPSSITNTANVSTTGDTNANNNAGNSTISVAPAPTSVTITVPAGVSYMFNSQTVTGSQTFQVAQGNYTLSTTTPQPLGAGVRAVFASWSDGGAISHSVPVGSSPITITGTFSTQFQLTTAASPANGGTVTPTSGTFFDSGTVVNLDATANSGFLFGSWTGPVASASSASTTVTMSAARSVTANFTAFTAPVVVTNPQNVSAAPGATATFTASATGLPAPTVKWQSSPDGVTFTDIGGANATSYSFTVQLADNGRRFRAVFTNAVTSVATTAATLTSGPVSFSGIDETGQGTWNGRFGADGFIIANGVTRLPSYATVNIGSVQNLPPAASAAAFTWAGLSSDPRALQNDNPATSRIASTFVAPDYGNSFRVRINVNDNNRHQVALYLLDWDTTLRAETIRLLDDGGGTLDTQSVSSFTNGKYVIWSFQGNITITVTGIAGSPVLSGIFFDAVGAGQQPQPTFTLSATGASANPGSSGSSTVTVVPANGFNAAVTLAQVGWPAGVTGTFGTNPTTDSSTVAINVAANVAAGSYMLPVNGTSGAIGATVNIPLTVNAIAAPPLAISATAVTIAAGASGTTTLTETPLPASGQFDLTLSTPGWPSGVTPGVRSNFTLPINVAANVTPGFYQLPLSATNGSAVATASISLTVTGASSTSPSVASFEKDLNSQGTWTGKFGSDGYRIANGANNLPAYAVLDLNGAPAFTWATATSDVKALQMSSGSASRIASSYYGNNTFGLNLTDGATHQVALYMLDWDGGNRSQKVEILDASNNGILDTQTFSNFSGGVWGVWNLKGNLKIRVTATGGGDGVISGFFFAPATGAPPPPSPSFTLTSTAASVGTGASGTSTVLVVPANGFNSQVTLSASNWPAGITGTFVPNPSGNTSTATITVGTTVAPGPYQLTVNGVSGALTASTVIALTVTSGSSGSSAAAFAGTDAATKGAWPGVYGSSGHLVANGTGGALTYAAATVTGAFTFTWSGQSTDPRALKLAPGSAFGIASSYYQFPGSSFNIGVTISDSALHKVSLYLLDWDGVGTTDTITVLDAVTGAVLDTQTVSDFQGGKYASWNIRGSVTFRVSASSGKSPVVSAVFFD